MLALISSIPTNVREGFDVQNLPLRASNLSKVTLANVFGSAFPCPKIRCWTDINCGRCQCIKIHANDFFGVCLSRQ
jgi:hypothetical protein